MGFKITYAEIKTCHKFLDVNKTYYMDFIVAGLDQAPEVVLGKAIGKM